MNMNDHIEKNNFYLKKFGEIPNRLSIETQQDSIALAHASMEFTCTLIASIFTASDGKCDDDTLKKFVELFENSLRDRLEIGSVIQEFRDHMKEKYGAQK